MHGKELATFMTRTTHFVFEVTSLAKHVYDHCFLASEYC